MIIYNVTINVDASVHDQWYDWMMTKHLQDMLDTGKFIKAQLVKVLVKEEMGGETYSAQFTAKTQADLEAYYKEDAPRLREEGMKLFADKMLAFRTELQVITTLEK